MKLKTLSLFIRIFLICLIAGIGSVCAQTSKTTPTESYLVNRGVSSQPVANGPKPYISVNFLVKYYNVPNYWTINPSKGKVGIDLKNNGKHVYIEKKTRPF